MGRPDDSTPDDEPRPEYDFTVGARGKYARRSVRPAASLLTSDMVGVGMNFAAEANPEANIEDTLIHASELGMDEGDLRVLSVLTTWFGIHRAHVNADRLVRVVTRHPSERVRAYWAALAAWQSKDRRFARLIRDYDGPARDLLPVGTDFQLARRGEDERFSGTPLRVPAGTLRDRPADVLTPEALVRLHPGYRNRVQMGPSWRADVWTVLEREPDVSVAEAARRAYCSFATAWQVSQDFRLSRRALDSASRTIHRA
ncbi:MAG: hypothetical protein ACQEXJ_15500 [Myxococcota bacterium]